MFASIEHVVYINLDERVDRKKDIQRELLTTFPAKKIERFSAIRNSNGGIGCTLSHIAVLERAKQENWANVMIVEDDFVWINREAGGPVLETLLQKPYDVIVLTGTYIDMNKSTFRLTSCQTTTAYVVARPYYDTLLTNYKEGLALLQQTGTYTKYALDQYWKLLQPVGQWYCVNPILGLQRPGYSDIERRVVNYSGYFKV
jgi:glycosyl transferase family 25